MVRIMQCQKFRFILTVIGLSIIASASMTSARAQTFADLKTALVDYSKADIEPGKACEAMSGFKSNDIVQITAISVAATAAAPANCRVAGLLQPEIAFEVSLPAKWNGRFYMIGNGGHAGESLDDPSRTSQRDDALKLGFAVAQTNTGHDSRKEPGGTFVLSNPQKAIDYAYRAVHLTVTTAKDVIHNYYGKPVSYAYWNSCSNGGRQGLIEAQRFPGDFDGVIANAPWLDQTGFTIGAMWNQKAISEAPLTPAKLSLLAEKVMAKCDSLDGLKDGLIDDPRKCSFDPARDVPACGEGTDGADCLTPAQAATIAKIYGGPISNGKSFFPGFALGSEAVMPALFGGGTGSGWMNVIVSTQPDGKAADFNLAENTMRYLVNKPPKPDYDYRTFDFDRDIHMLDEWGKQADAKNPDLANFRSRGGKLIMTYGWADSILQPMMGVNYYEQALAKNGPDAMDFFRLFMVPGMAHCSGGIGPDRNDTMTAMINWVEKGKAPESIQASRVVDGKVVRTRPLCPYPQVARYTGQGSIDDAANFRCVKP
ncbi:MAG TPA: tannase/feruloyl esterase family alpha/beta hydrolase [Acidobacteriota bacterium]|nr:tannase/feruloyl esterase family alpha/beta hydrolase [Acidobacteriota bacterium]